MDDRERKLELPPETQKAIREAVAKDFNQPDNWLERFLRRAFKAKARQKEKEEGKGQGTRGEQIGSEIFRALRSRGPLSASQISVELVLPLRDIVAGLKYLLDKGVIEKRPDSDTPEGAQDDEIVWGLPTLHFGKR